MIDKIGLKISLVALLVASSANAVNVTIDEIQYTPKELREQITLTAPEYSGQIITFAEQRIVATEGLKLANSFVDGQDQLSKLRRDALKSVVYSAAFTIQNAHDSVALQNYSTTAADVANCGYFGMDKEITFIVEKMFTKLTMTKEDKQRLIYGSMELSDLMPLYTNQKHIQESVMQCSENIKKWSKHLYTF